MHAQRHRVTAATPLLLAAATPLLLGDDKGRYCVYVPADARPTLEQHRPELVMVRAFRYGRWCGLPRCKASNSTKILCGGDAMVVSPVSFPPQGVKL